MVLISVIYGRRNLEIPRRSSRAYVYDAPDDVAVGDIVLVPPTWLHTKPQEATVVAVDSEPPDDIEITAIVKIVERVTPQ